MPFLVLRHLLKLADAVFDVIVQLLLELLHGVLQDFLLVGPQALGRLDATSGKPGAEARGGKHQILARAFLSSRPRSLIFSVTNYYKKSFNPNEAELILCGIINQNPLARPLHQAEVVIADKRRQHRSQGGTNMSADFALRSTIAIATVAAAAGTAAVQAAQVGPMFTVVAPTTQLPLSNDLSLASSSKGFVVGWTLEQAQASGASLATAHVGIYDTGANAIAADIALGAALPVVNGFAWSRSPGVSINDKGNIVAAWEQPNSSSSTQGLRDGVLYAQRYSVSGQSQGKKLRIANTQDYRYPFGREIFEMISAGPEVAIDPDGDFAVAWNESGYFGFGCATGPQPGGCISTIIDDHTYAASYAANGTLRAKKTVIDQPPSGYVYPPQTQPAGIALLSDGSFKAVFGGAYPASTGGNSVPATIKTFNPGLVQTDSVTIDGLIPSSGAFDSQGDIFLVTGPDVLSRYTASGTSLGSDISNPGQAFAAWCVAPSGRFAVAWQPTYVSFNIDAQYYNADGSADGGVVSVQSTTGDSLQKLNCTLDDGGHLVVLWSSVNSESSLTNIAGRIVSK